MQRRITVKAFIYEEELNYISRCALDYPNLETGGDLFGFWTHTGCPVIQYVIGPGRKANHEVSFFNQELEYLDNCGKILRSGHALQHIGQWHSHHQLGLAEPSQHDANTVYKAIRQYQLQQFFLVITNIRENSSTINGFLFRKENGRQFEYAGWEVLSSENPIRRSVDARYPEILSVPHTISPSISNLITSSAIGPAPAQTDVNANNWLAQKANHSILKQMLDALTARFGECLVSIDTATNMVCITFIHSENKYRLLLPKEFPVKEPLIQRWGAEAYEPVAHHDDTCWAAGDDISISTVQFVITILDANNNSNQSPIHQQHYDQSQVTGGSAAS